MKSLYKKFSRKWLITGLIALLLITGVFFSCVYLDSIEYDTTLTAGKTATFTVNMHIEAIQDNTSRLVFSILVPKSWNTSTNTTVTYTSSYEDGVVKTMSLIPTATSPKNQPGLSWADALKAHLGVGPNVIDEMEWVTYWSDDVYNVHNRDNVSAVITIKAKVGPDNMNVKLGFLINTSDDGLSWNTSNQYTDYKFTDCINVIGGDQSAFIDFCEKHFNFFTPGNATKNDIVTVKFQGDIQANALDGTNEIYLIARAFTDASHEYDVTSCTTKNHMKNESGKTYSLTFWPANYFGIPSTEEITHIDYYFTNKDGSLSVMQPDDAGGPDTWFSSSIVCK